ncbi:DNA-binding GntR family transcriptional regulator [Pseudonocardia sediminis]|uniref:DNA-binding GntR family transcriptional regulator n=1 Tax=Pseudonocardia sediminis TaxID=1397368 RepID=A0A4Q7V7Y3_PSEST|nr:DNA-binding GntR family transcriptional regulator [Pseudonocardia sediminis]
MTTESSAVGTRVGADQSPPLDVGYGRAGDRVTAALREMIANGQLEPGEHLRQDELATRLGSTRVPVREAFKTLAAEGVLHHRRNHGHYVAKLTAAELAEICWLRDACENRLAATARRPGEDELAGLRASNDAMYALTGGTAYEIVQADRLFHERFWVLSPMRIVAGETARMWALIQPYRSFMDYGEAVVSRMHGEHTEIVDALAAGDTARYCTAVELHQRHIYDVIDDLAAREDDGVAV